jgi:hypothetical protein
VQQLVQGGALGGLVIGRQRGREFRHDVPVERGRGVAEVAGEFGAELARAIRVGLAPPGPGPYGSRGPSELTWYAFAVTYARDHWVGRAATTRNDTSEALAHVDNCSTITIGKATRFRPTPGKAAGEVEAAICTAPG